MPELFTIVLTKGAYVVREEDALAVLTAIESRAPHVLVNADILGDEAHFTPVRIVLGHVISVVSNLVPANPKAKERLTLV